MEAGSGNTAARQKLKFGVEEILGRGCGPASVTPRTTSPLRNVCTPGLHVPRTRLAARA